MPEIDAIARAFQAAFRDYCSRSGVSTVAFWRLGLAELPIHNAQALRNELEASILAGGFDERHVPAFLLLIQTQAAGHSYRLWEDTVIPLLAGMGPDRLNRQFAFRQRFAGELPIRAALRGWLDRYSRSSCYTQEGHHFWFVRAVIGECALVWISSEFTEQFLDGMFSDWARTTDPRDLAQRRFDSLLQAFRTSKTVSQEELGSINALRECLVEAGIRLAVLAKLIRGQIPPDDGWTVDSLLDRARNILGTGLSGLPAAIVAILRKHIAIGIEAYSLDQLQILFRRHPAAVLRFNGGSWSLRSSGPPPIGNGTMQLDGDVVRRVMLLDDLGRTADEIVGVLKRAGDAWHIDNDMRWRASRSNFCVPHPSRLRTQSRPVIGTNGSLSTPDAWVWVGPISDDELLHSGHLFGQEPTAHSGQSWAAPSRLRLFAWPSLDRELHPVFYVSRFWLGDGENDRVTLSCESVDGRADRLWSNAGSRGWHDVRCRAPATAGGKTLFSVRQGTTGTSTTLAEISLRWPCPSLFAAGRRLLPGQHLLPQEGSIILLTTETPEIAGARCQEIVLSHPSLDKSRVYEVIPQNGCETTVATAGERWSFDPRRRPLARLRLMPSDANISEISSSSFAFSDPGIQVFFGAPPLLCLSVDFQHDDVRLEAEQVLELLDHVELTAGMDAESVPSIRVPCKRLRNDFSVIPSASGVQLRLPLESFLSIELTEPGFNVRRIALDGWLELEEGAGGTLGVSGQSERFVVLPYNLETPLPRSPEIPGGVRLEDTSGLHNPFELREATSNEIPSEGQVVAEAVYLSNRFPFSNLDLLKRTDLTLLGAWFWKDEWDLEALRTFLIDTFTPCARVVIPNVDQKVQIAVNTGESITPRDFLVATILQGPVVGDLNLLKLLPRELFEDTPAQKKWLGSPYSSICLESDGRKVGGISLDLRPCVLGFKMLHQGIPSLAGGTTCQLEVEVICGFVAGESLEIIAIPLAAGEPEQSEERFPVQMNSSGLDRQIHCCSVSVREPGEYRLALRRKGETFAIRSLDITAFSPAIPEGDTPLTDFLESWPSGEPALANATLLYRFLRNLYEPWHEYSLYTLIDRSRDAIRDQKSILYQLIDTLLGYLDDPPRTAARVSLIQPENVPAGILAEVGTVAIQLQFYTEPPLRNRLAAWKATLSQAASDESRTSEERTWLKALADAANRLKTDSGSAASVTHRSNEHFVQPYFPCRADFLRFLQGYEHRTNRPLARETT